MLSAGGAHFQNNPPACSCKCNLHYFWPNSKQVLFPIKSELAPLSLAGIPHEELQGIKTLELLMKKQAAAACAHREFLV